jgi:diguanylate cyclase (GGDEF)-like protein
MSGGDPPSAAAGPDAFDGGYTGVDHRWPIDASSPVTAELQILPGQPRRAALELDGDDALDSVAAGVLVLDADQRVERANREACRLLGERSRIVGQSLATALLTKRPSGHTAPLMSSELMARSVGLGRGVRATAHLLGRGGSLVPVDYALLCRERDGDVVGWTVTLVDVSDREASHARLHWKATHDDLTGLANRAALTAHVEGLLRDAPITNQWPAMLFIDLDRFKFVNDAHGHSVGDQLVTIAADRISALVGARDLVARFGGDEFVVVVSGEHCEPDRVTRLAESIRALLNEKFLISGVELVVPASLGVAYSGPTVHTASDLLRAADMAMYLAKTGGRNQVVVADDELAQAAEKRSAIVRGLRAALKSDGLHVVYQPICELASNELVGFEALARWAHPLLGDIDPPTFVRIAEEAGLITALGERVVDLALGAAATWSADDARQCGVNVNVSSQELMVGDYPAMVLDGLRRHGVAADRLTIEVTEGVLLHDPDLAYRHLKRLSDAGVRLALDDFGTGYSSLSYLRRFPLDVLKIDREFVSGIGAAVHSQRIVRAMCDIAVGSGIRVLAEGIETQSELRTVGELGCALGQGHLLGMPLPSDEARCLVLRRRGTSRLGGIEHRPSQQRVHMQALGA